MSIYEKLVGTLMLACAMGLVVAFCTELWSDVKKGDPAMSALVGAVAVMGAVVLFISVGLWMS